MNLTRIVLLLAVCIFVSVSSADAKTTLVIVTGEIPPAISHNADQSFLTAVFQAIEPEMGVRFEFRFLPWKRCEEAVSKLTAWGAIPYVSTPERQKKYAFSNRLYKSASKLFGYSLDGSETLSTYSVLKDLKPYRVGGVRGYWYEHLFHEAGIQLFLVTDERQNIKKLYRDRIDLAPFEETAGWYMINKLYPMDRDRFFTMTPPLSTHDAFLITSKQYPGTQALLDRFNSALKLIKENGTFLELMETYGVKFTP
nr:transporter substrate-binding domain-containing protein [uncultured Desulfobacter sp.]